MMDKDYDKLVRMIRHMPEAEPPCDLADLVCDSLKPKSLPIWKRMYRTMTTPFEISITPARMIPVVAVCVCLIVVIYSNNDTDIQLKTHKSEINLVPIIFTLDQMSAKSVYVVGSFNDWNPKLHQMIVDPKTKRWILKLMLPPGQHEYAFIIDGDRIVPDPKASIKRHDGFGSYNSVVFTHPNDETYL